jgi:hypothetical protein
VHRISDSQGPCTEPRGETVWKIAEGFLAVRFWRQEAADPVLFASVGGLRSPELGLIPIFQTVSEGEFCEVELPLYGVLRSSARKRRAEALPCRRCAEEAK